MSPTKLQSIRNVKVYLYFKYAVRDRRYHRTTERGRYKDHVRIAMHRFCGPTFLKRWEKSCVDVAWQASTGPQPIVRAVPIAYTHLKQAFHLEGQDLKSAFFAGLSAVPHVHEVHDVRDDGGYTMWIRWVTLFATRTGAAALELVDGGGTQGSCPSTAGVHPVLRVATTLCRAIRSETPRALS